MLESRDDGNQQRTRHIKLSRQDGSRESRQLAACKRERAGSAALRARHREAENHPEDGGRAP